MKLLKSLVLVVAASLMMMSCGGGASTPTSVVEKVCEATKNLDLNTIKKYVAKAYVPQIEEAIKQMDSPESKAGMEMVKGMMKEAKFEVVKEDIAADGNSANVTVKVTAMGQSKEQVMPLVKEDGEWKLNSNPNLGK